MATLDPILGWFSFLLTCVAVLIAPWLFGAWEAWWFWPFAVCIFAAAFLLSLRLVTGSHMRGVAGPRRTRIMVLLGAVCLPFLVYACVRFLQAEVFMDAERSFMLFLTPIVLATMIVIGFTRSQNELLYALITMDLFLLGCYGLLNHHLTGSTRVMWVLSEYEQYAGRATGSYFCPDHFSGIMELLFCLGLGLVLKGRRTDTGEQDLVADFASRLLAAPLLMVALAGIVLSQSRGGGITIVVGVMAALILVLRHFPAWLRWALRIGAIAVMILAISAFWQSDNDYAKRFRSYFAWEEMHNRSRAEKVQVLEDRLKATSRYNMYSAAYRAWKTEPWYGVGPGMHQHLWYRFAASPDGNRGTGEWPSRPNAGLRSYEVHSDWLQLLEEYGVVGLLLFLLMAVTIFTVLEIAVVKSGAHYAVVGAVLAAVCIAFHSLGDFNMQMPATVWIFAAILAIPLADTIRSSS